MYGLTVDRSTLTHTILAAANVITSERVREVMLAVDRGNYAPDRPYDDR